MGLPSDAPLYAISSGVWPGSVESWEKWSKFISDKYAPGEPLCKATNEKRLRIIKAADEVPVHDFETGTIRMIPNPMKPTKQAVFCLHERRKAQAKQRQ